MNTKPVNETELHNAKLRVAVTAIGECLSDLGIVLSQGGKRADNQSKIGGIAFGLERAAAYVRGIDMDEHTMKATTQLDDIAAFHEKFQQAYNGDVRFMPEDMMEFRTRFMQEELDEFKAAVAARDMAKAFDALVDLDYVKKGTVYMMGLALVYGEGWRRVHAANMAKVLAESAEHSAASTGRGYVLDVVKPPGWKPPDHSDLIGEQHVERAGRAP